MMKSSLKKLRDFTLGAKDKRQAYGTHHQHEDHMETLTTSMQVLTDMREQYDGLLAAAQSISGSSYDFSRSIHEMASYMQETFGQIGDGDTASSFSMLGKVQYEISKQLDFYAAHVSQTIIKPTENLLKELQSVEEIKEQYVEKRDLYNQLRLQKPKVRRKKGDAVDQQLTTIKEDLDNQAMVLDLRFQSLKHEQELSLLTQVARHHMAQVHLFQKGLNSLNAVESILKHLSNELHIDLNLSEDDAGFNMNDNNFGVEANLENGDKGDSTPSSPSSSQPLTTERNQHRVASNLKMWEHTSKSAPLHPSAYSGIHNVTTRHEPHIEKDSEKTATYALPSPGSNARFHSQVAFSRSSGRPEFHRTRTGSAATYEEAMGLTGLLNMEGYRQSGSRHSMARDEEINSWKESKSTYAKVLHMKRSPSHTYSTSYSEGLDALSASSDGYSGPFASTPTFSDKRSTKDSDAMLALTHSVDPLYRSGPVGQSSGLSWGRGTSRISPCASPPVSHLPPPLISELHMLPAPPPPPKQDPVIIHSAELRMKVTTEPGRRSVTTPPMLSSSMAAVKKSRSIPSSVNFAQSPA